VAEPEVVDATRRTRLANALGLATPALVFVH
jgi:hypothetical protein